MKIVPLEGTKLPVSELAELARDEAVILTRDGNPVVSVRVMAGSDSESASLSRNPQFMELIERSRRSYRNEGVTRIDQLRRELDLDSQESNESSTPLN